MASDSAESRVSQPGSPTNPFYPPPSPSSSSSTSEHNIPPVSPRVLERLQGLSRGDLNISYERGFLMNEEDSIYRDLFVSPCVTRWGWEHLVEQPSVPVPVQLVHDFVANFPSTPLPTSVVVRGVTVDISAENIQRLYNLDYSLDREDHFLRIISTYEDPVLHQTIASQLCGDVTAPWDSGELLLTDLNKDAHIWAKFVAHRFIPRMIKRHLNPRVAVAVYSILAGLSFHPAQLLYQELCNSSRHAFGPFHLPALVKRLCDAAGVPASAADADIIPFPKRSFGRAWLKKICEGRIHRPPPPPAFSPPPSGRKMALLEQRMNKQEELITSLTQYLRDIRPCCQSVFNQSFPFVRFPELPIDLQQPASPASSSSGSADDAMETSEH